MVAFFFKTISHLLFVPIAAGTMLGVISIFVFQRKKKDLFWIITVSCLFMTVWRFAFQNVMITARYFSILLYPALILTAFFCFHLELILLQIVKKWGADKNLRLETACRIIPWFFILGILIASLAKVFHFDPNSDGIIKVCQAYLKDRQGKEIVYTYEVNGTEQRRIRYYGGINPQSPEPVLLFSDQPNDVILAQWMDILRERRNFSGPHFFFYFHRKGEKDVLPPEDVLANGEWTEISRCATSRNRKKNVILYRYIPYCKNVENWEKPIPKMSKENFCPNGDFERILSGVELEQRMAYLKNNKASDFYFAPERLFPEKWGIRIYKPFNGISSDMALTTNSPIAGTYSMSMKSVNQGSACMYSALLAMQDCMISAFVRAIEDTAVTIYSGGWDNDEKKTSLIEKVTFTAFAGKTYRVTIPFLQKNVPEEVDLFYLEVQSCGHILVDNIEFVPNE